MLWVVRAVLLPLAVSYAVTGLTTERSALDDVFCIALTSEILKVSLGFESKHGRSISIVYETDYPVPADIKSRPISDEIKSCVHSALGIAKVDTHYENPSSDRPFVVPGGIEIAAGSGIASAMLISGILSTADRNGGRTTSVLEFELIESVWRYKGARPTRFTHLCKTSGC